MPAKTAVPERLYPTRRDMEALEALYFAKLISVGHLVRVLWNDRAYAYKRLNFLASHGYVRKLNLFENMSGTTRRRRKVSVLAYLGKKGTEALRSVLGDGLRAPYIGR